MGLKLTSILGSYSEQELLGFIIVNSILFYRLRVKFFLPGCTGIHVYERPKASFVVRETFFCDMMLIRMSFSREPGV